MSKVENQTLAAEVMKNVFKDRYADCVFANKAELVSAHGIPGPVWMLKGIIGWTQVVFQGQTGAHLQVLEMCDLDRHLQTVTDEEIKEKRKEIEEFFIISEDAAADPLAQKPTEEQLNWSAKIAVAQEKLVEVGMVEVVIVQIMLVQLQYQ